MVLGEIMNAHALVANSGNPAGLFAVSFYHPHEKCLFRRAS
jgi:hypothetical protein